MSIGIDKPLGEKGENHNHTKYFGHNQSSDRLPLWKHSIDEDITILRSSKCAAFYYNYDSFALLKQILRQNELFDPWMFFLRI